MLCYRNLNVSNASFISIYLIKYMNCVHLKISNSSCYVTNIVRGTECCEVRRVAGVKVFDCERTSNASTIVGNSCATSHSVEIVYVLCVEP
jgi:hypothetical protein